MKKKILSALLAVLMVFSATSAYAQVTLPSQEHTAPTLQTQSCTSGFSCDYTLTGDGPSDMAAIALAQEGRTGAQFGYTEEWCANFISDCAIIAGQTEAIPQYGGVAGLYDRLLSAGATEVTDTPRVGDLCFINWNGGTSMGHVEVVYSVSDGKVYTIGGNSGSADSLSDRLVKKHAPLSSKYILSILRPNYVTKSFTLTYEVNGGTGAPASQSFSDSVTVGSEIPIRDGYYFLGWSLDDACTEIHHLPGDTLSPSGDLTLYAVWAQIQCGDTMEWSMSGTQVKINGSGAMYDYTDALPPWYPLRNSIKSITFQDGITSIGQEAFMNSAYLEELSFREGLSFIASRAFSGCERLTDVYYGGTAELWETIYIGEENEPLLNATVHCHIHEYVTETQEPTCTEPGYIRSTCTLCGHSETETIEPTGHNQLGNSCPDCGIMELSIPVILSCYSKVQTSVKVTWTVVEGADGYELWRTADPSDPESWIRTKTITDGMQDRYTNQNLSVGTTYYYRVRAYRQAENGDRTYSEFSDIAYMPAAVVIDNPYSNGTDRIRLRWLPINGANGYQIWRQEPDGSYRIIKTIGDKGNELTQDQGHVTGYTNTELISGDDYTYRLRAFTITSDGIKIFGAYSDEFTVAVTPMAPTLVALQAKPTRAQLQWDFVNGAEGYQIWLEQDSGARIKKTIFSGDITNATIYDLVSGENYIFKIRAYTEIDGKKSFSAFSETVCVIVE